jgi:hypothetical protein
MSNKINVVWSFEDTEFEDLQYEEARENASLPKVVKIDFDEDEDEIESYLYENYGFEIKEWEYVD